MDLNHEAILDQLTSFEVSTSAANSRGNSEQSSNGNTSNDAATIPDLLERYLEYIARTGDTLFPWHKIKNLIKKKTEFAIDEFNRQNPSTTIGATPNMPLFNFQELRDCILSTIDNFYGAPFTIQRICELITAPSKHYKRTDKFMRGLEKNILVVSYIEPRLSIGEQPAPPVMAPSYHPFSLSSVAGSSGYIANGSPSSPNAPAPLQQLDSFTTVFSSPPSTPLAVVSDMQPYDDGSSSSSSSGSSAESSPTTNDVMEPNSNGTDSLAPLGESQPLLTSALADIMNDGEERAEVESESDSGKEEPSETASTSAVEAMEVSNGGSTEDLTRIEQQQLPSTSSAALQAMAAEQQATELAEQMKDSSEASPMKTEAEVSEPKIEALGQQQSEASDNQMDTSEQPDELAGDATEEVKPNEAPVSQASTLDTQGTEFIPEPASQKQEQQPEQQPEQQSAAADELAPVSLSESEPPSSSDDSNSQEELDRS